MKLIFPNCDSIVAETPIYADGTVAWDRAEAWVYEPGSFRPLAKLQGEDLYYVVTDHIGTPRELISEDGTRTAWRARLGLWGETEALTRRAANYNAAPDCAIRFQGQWFDEESGLHYNRFRYYDPEAGQYLSPDPIGLAGGVRPQGYVADPNGWIDPLGLNACFREVNGTKIYGKGQKDGTPGHDQFSEVIANKLAMSGKFREIHLNRQYNSAVGPSQSTRRLDVMAIDHAGRVHAIELASKSDMGRKLPSLTTRNQAAMNGLPVNQRGEIVVIEHPYKAVDIKNTLDNLIDGI